MQKYQSERGFTLIEMAVVIGIIALLATIVVIAVNPKKNFSQAQNTQRAADIQKILGALNEYAIEKNGSFPSAVSTTLQMIGTSASGCSVPCLGASTTAASCTDLTSTFVPTYLQSIPMDPKVGSAAMTYYAVQRINNGVNGVGLLIRACSPELSQVIETRQ